MCAMQAGPEIVLLFIILSISTEALTELIVSSKLLEPIRHYIKKMTYPQSAPPADDTLQNIKVTFDYLINCGYCVSVWVAAITSLYVSQSIYDWIIITLLIHRISNWLHVIYELVKRGRVHTVDMTMHRDQLNDVIQ